MARRVPITICLILTSTAAFVYLLNKWVSQMAFVQHPPQEYSWIVHGIINILGYLTLLLPGYLIYKYIQKINYMNKGSEGLCARAIHLCFGEEDPAAAARNNANLTQRTTYEEMFLIIFHFLGLQFSYLTWGVLQEKVMTQEYHTESGESERFADSQFLVFMNRILAFFTSGVYIFCCSHIRHRCPLYKYTFCSFSNIMSAWCQYEALKYVSFPHQVLAKAAKTIPVMIMGKLLSNVKYEFYEYATSVILSVGMLVFMLDAGNDQADSAVTTFSGALLLILYITFDSFTSNWQGALFKTYHMKPVQMMCFVNLFSCLFTAVSLLQQGAYLYSLNFMYKYPRFILDCVILSACSTVGQLFIFSTISKFGPLIFAIMSTIRQGLSVLLSCLIYKHHLSVIGALGVILVFLSVFLRIYWGHRLKNMKKHVYSKPQGISV